MTGYLLLFIYDLAKYRHKPVLRNITTLGFPLTGVPYLIILMDEIPLSWNVQTLLFAVSLAVLLSLLVYSVLIEIPLHLHRHPQKATAAAPVTYAQGTYAFSRHPGFIWYTLINVLFAISFFSIPMVLLMLSFTGCNLILVIIEDRFIFPGTFSDYHEYKKTTAFLIQGRRNTTSQEP
jgi:protein-S-isoprenylcysteine O-methyltransferase Ste14